MAENNSDRVALGYLFDEEVAHSFMDSALQLGFMDAGTHLSGIIKMRAATGDLVGGRNAVVQEFLKRGDDWLLFIDTDMGFQSDTLERLLKYADPVKRPIVGGLCFIQREFEGDDYNGSRTRIMPTVIDYVKVPFEGKEINAFMSLGWYPPNTLLRCAATGMACVLIHRSVFWEMQKEYGEHWFDQLQGEDGKPMGEDISFCAKCEKLAIPIHVHTGIRTTHLKPIWLGEDDFWRTQTAPPAEDRVLVVVPVLHRPANAEPFMRSLRASTGLADVVAVADDDDILTIAAWQEQGVTVMKGKEHTFAEKLNRAYRDAPVLNTSKIPGANRFEHHKWIFMTGDDVSFFPGWYDQAVWMAGNTKAKVIGTNDLGNPRVERGEHGTHLLISREYIDEVGASWDGPKIVAHEGYHHWYVDDEIVTAAKQRGVWASAVGSYVDHMHPYFGKGQMDSTYEEGEKHAEADGELFQRRLKENQ